MVDPLTRQMIAYHVADLSHDELQDLVLLIAEEDPALVVAAITGESTQDNREVTSASAHGPNRTSSTRRKLPAAILGRRSSSPPRDSVREDYGAAMAQNSEMSVSDQERLGVLVRLAHDFDWVSRSLDDFVEFVVRDQSQQVRRSTFICKVLSS